MKDYITGFNPSPLPASMPFALWLGSHRANILLKGQSIFLHPLSFGLGHMTCFSQQNEAKVIGLQFQALAWRDLALLHFCYHYGNMPGRSWILGWWGTPSAESRSWPADTGEAELACLAQPRSIEPHWSTDVGVIINDWCFKLLSIGVDYVAITDKISLLKL